jgi:hypothetical protein
MDDSKACHADISPLFLSMPPRQSDTGDQIRYPRSATWLRNSSIGVAAVGWVTLHQDVAVAMEPPPHPTPSRSARDG